MDKKERLERLNEVMATLALELRIQKHLLTEARRLHKAAEEALELAEDIESSLEEAVSSTGECIKHLEKK